MQLLKKKMRQNGNKRLPQEGIMQRMQLVPQ